VDLVGIEPNRAVDNTQVIDFAYTQRAQNARNTGSLVRFLYDDSSVFVTRIGHFQT
jgi:hypothetical protein